MPRRARRPPRVFLPNLPGGLHTGIHNPRDGPEESFADKQLFSVVCVETMQSSPGTAASASRMNPNPAGTTSQWSKLLYALGKIRLFAPYIGCIVAVALLIFLDKMEERVALIAILVISAIVLARRTCKYKVGLGEDSGSFGVMRKPIYKRPD